MSAFPPTHTAINHHGLTRASITAVPNTGGVRDSVPMINTREAANLEPVCSARQTTASPVRPNHAGRNES